MRKLVRNLTAAALMAGFALSLSGCGSTVAGTPEAYNGGWWRSHMHGYMSVLKRDVTNIYRTFDRHFMDYDWNDPRY